MSEISRGQHKGLRKSNGQIQLGQSFAKLCAERDHGHEKMRVGIIQTYFELI